MSINLLRYCQLPNNRRSKSYIRIFHIQCPIWVKLGTRYLHVMLSDVYEFHESRLREGRTFLRAVNAITCVP